MLNYLRWFYKVSWTLAKELKAKLFLIVVMGLFSRISSMLALLLPVKIILLVSSNRVPKYFPEFLHQIPSQTLMVALCLATVFFYASHVLLEKIILSVERKAEAMLISQLKAPSDDSGAVKALKKVSNKVSKSLTELCFVVVVLLFISIAYPTLFLTIFLYAAVVLIVYELMVSPESHVEEEVEDGHEEDSKSGVVIGYLTDVGFLFSFFFIVIGMLIGWGPSIITAFICFLLLRRSSGGIKQFIKSLVVVFNNQKKLSWIYSKAAVDSKPEEGDQGAGLESEALIDRALLEVFPGCDVLSSRLCETGERRSDKYIVTARVGIRFRRCVVKIFNKKNRFAKEERELYQELLKSTDESVVESGSFEGQSWVLVSFSFVELPDAELDKVNIQKQ